jgi:hypothetical protein
VTLLSETAGSLIEIYLDDNAKPIDYCRNFILFYFIFTLPGLAFRRFPRFYISLISKGTCTLFRHCQSSTPFHHLISHSIYLALHTDRHIPYHASPLPIPRFLFLLRPVEQQCCVSYPRFAATANTRTSSFPSKRDPQGCFSRCNIATPIRSCS